MRALPSESRAALYRLCADLLTREVDLQRLPELEKLAGVMVAADPSLGSWFASADETSLADLRAEFARLFLLPKGVPAQASAWLPTGAGSPSDQIARVAHVAMEALELGQSGLAGLLAHDHLALLLAIAATGLDSPVRERVAIGEHLERAALMPERWCARFGRALEKGSEEPLYRALGSLIQGLMDSLSEAGSGSSEEPRPVQRRLPG